MLIGVWLLGSPSVYGQAEINMPAASHGFLDLQDPYVVTDETGQRLLTFARVRCQ